METSVDAEWSVILPRQIIIQMTWVYNLWINKTISKFASLENI